MERLVEYFLQAPQKSQVITIAVTLSVVMFLRQGVVGIGFLEIGQTFSDGGTYALLDSLFRLEYWGILYLLNALMYLVAAITAMKTQSIRLLVVCGIMGTALMFFYVNASWANSATKVHTYGYIITLSLNIFIAFLGGVSTWLMGKEKDTIVIKKAE